MLGHGRDESAPTPDGMFAPHFVGVRWYFAECFVCISLVFATFWQSVSSRRGRFIVPAYPYSPRIRNPFRMPSRNVHNVFVICMLHIRRAKVWFLACKNPLFTLQKPPFWRARSGFLQSLN